MMPFMAVVWYKLYQTDRERETLIEKERHPGDRKIPHNSRIHRTYFDSSVRYLYQTYFDGSISTHRQNLI